MYLCIACVREHWRMCAWHIHPSSPFTVKFVYSSDKNPKILRPLKVKTERKWCFEWKRCFVFVVAAYARTITSYGWRMRDTNMNRLKPELKLAHNSVDDLYLFSSVFCLWFFFQFTFRMQIHIRILGNQSHWISKPPSHRNGLGVHIGILNWRDKRKMVP